MHSGAYLDLGVELSGVHEEAMCLTLLAPPVVEVFESFTVEAPLKT